MVKNGKCRICGYEGEMTFEHLPPKSANNRMEAKVYSGEAILKLLTEEERIPWNFTHLRYQSMQRGTGDYSLCESCNNLTGAYYGEAYSDIANDFMKYYINNKELIEENDVLECTLHIFPLRFIKQVLSMFCSTTMGLVDEYPELKQLILNKEQLLNYPNFKVSMYLLKDNVYFVTDKNAELTIATGETRFVSEMCLFPLGFVFDYDKHTKDNSLLDITSFLSYKYDDDRKIKMVIPIKHKNIPLPLNYEGREEYLKRVGK